METEKLLNFSCEMGRQLLQNGAEIYRAEESIRRLLAAYGRTETEVFAIPSCIILNIQEGERNYTKSIRVRTVSNNLRKLSNLNALCRDICREPPPVEESVRRMEAIVSEPVYSALTGFMAHGLVAFFFTLFWGGDLLDAAAAFPCGLVVRAVLVSMRRLRANEFLTYLAAAMLAALEPLVLAWAGAPVNTDKMIIGTIMLLVPGIAMTNVMRDVLAGDFLTALTRLAEVLIVGMAITVGVAMAITLTRFVLGGAL